MQRSLAPLLVLVATAALVALAAWVLIEDREQVPGHERLGSPRTQARDALPSAGVRMPGEAEPDSARGLVESSAEPAAEAAPLDRLEEARRTLLLWFASQRGRVAYQDFLKARAAGLLALEAYPELAFELLLESGQRDADLFQAVGLELRRAGLGEEAAEAFARGAAFDPEDRGIFRCLLQQDPERALAMVEELVGGIGLMGSQAVSMNLAEALLALDRRAECTRLVERMLADRPGDAQWISLLELVDPDAAIYRLQLLAAASPERWSKELYSFLDKQGRRDEAARALLVELDRQPRNVDLIGRLGLLAPELGYERLSSSYPGATIDDDIADAFNELGEALWNQGDPERAIRSWTQAVLRYELNWDGTLMWSPDFEAHAPEELIKAIEQRTPAVPESGFIGQLARVYWNSGRKDEAQALWMTGASQFPDEPAWQQNLEAVAKGEPPPWLAE